MTEMRESGPADAARLETLYLAAFPDEDLRPLLRDLHQAGSQVRSIVATRNREIIAHVAFTLCSLEGSDRSVALLGPLAVAPEAQRQGLGKALIAEGLARMREEGVGRVLVLGDPTFYGQSGFEAEKVIAPPYSMPEGWAGAWQSLSLSDLGIPRGARLVLPRFWQNPALWGA